MDEAELKRIGEAAYARATAAALALEAQQAAVPLEVAELRERTRDAESGMDFWRKVDEYQDELARREAGADYPLPVDREAAGQAVLNAMASESRDQFFDVLAQAGLAENDRGEQQRANPNRW